MSTRGGLAGAGKKCVVTTNCEKSAEAIVPGEKNSGRAEQSLVLSKRKKEVNMMNAEYPGTRSCPQKDNAEHEEYVGAQSVGGQEVGEQDGADLLERILNRDNLNRAGGSWRSRTASLKYASSVSAPARWLSQIPRSSSQPVVPEGRPKWSPLPNDLVVMYSNSQLFLRFLLPSTDGLMRTLW